MRRSVEVRAMKQVVFTDHSANASDLSVQVYLDAPKVFLLYLINISFCHSQAYCKPFYQIKRNQKNRYFFVLKWVLTV